MKARSLQKINWINGSWISNNEVKLSINDRGVTLGDGIFETILIYQNILKQELGETHRMLRRNRGICSISI